MLPEFPIRPIQDRARKQAIPAKGGLLEPPLYFPAKIKGVNLDTIIGANPATYNLLSHILFISLIS
jgi:hypothetical protein